MNEQITTARATGAWYLGVALTGVLSFMIVRPKLYFPDSPGYTIQTLAERQGLARFSVILELGLVLTQALAAIWFYKLLKDVRPVAAVAVAGFGLVNSVAILASALFMATASEVAAHQSILDSTETVGMVGLMHLLSTNAWGVGAIFFGLWLIPMGWAAVSSERFPEQLGWLLIAGGVGYLLSVLLDYGMASAPSLLLNLLVIPASIGEFWMIAYLLLYGIRPEVVETQ